MTRRSIEVLELFWALLDELASAPVAALRARSQNVLMTGLDSWATQFGAGLHGKLAVDMDGDDENLAPIDRWRRAARKYIKAMQKQRVQEKLWLLVA